MAENKGLERIKRIIRELQKKTVENGCSEEEALSAAKRMGELLDEHNLEMDEVDVRAETAQCRKNTVRAVDDFASNICVGIAEFCDLRVWKSSPTEFTFFGTPHDLEVGAYLYEVCMEALDYDWGHYMDIHGYSMKKRASFRMGFAGRVTHRLREIKEARRRAATGTALVVLKDQLVKQEFDKLNMRLRAAKGRTAADASAYYSGQASGNKVNLNNPLGSNANATTAIK